jgi:hypothetical protein
MQPAERTERRSGALASALLLACMGGCGGETTAEGGAVSGSATGGSGGSVATAGAGGSVLAGGSVGAGLSYEWQGRVYADGTSFMSSDGCAVCTCERGSVSCTSTDCGSSDAGSGPSSADAADVDPGLLGTWLFFVPTDAVRWCQVALCAQGRALLLTSLTGTGEPDQQNPTAGTWRGSGLAVVASFEDPALGSDPVTMQFEYDTERDSLRAVGGSVLAVAGITAIRPILSSLIVPELTCD